MDPTSLAPFAWTGKASEIVVPGAACLVLRAMGLIGADVPAVDDVVYYSTAERHPPEFLTWIPIIGGIVEATKKRYLLAATKDSLLVIRIRKFRWEEIESEMIPMREIQSSSVHRYPLLCNLRISRSDGRTYVFKELFYEMAAGMKDAIDQVQGNPSSFD